MVERNGLFIPYVFDKKAKQDSKRSDRKVKNDKVLKLKKVLYGLKQAPGAWYNRIDKYFQENNFTKCPNEHGLYVKIKDGNILIMCIYVDDLIFL